MRTTRLGAGAVATAMTAALILLPTAPAAAAASIEVGDPILMQSKRTLDVTVRATCDAGAQDSTFIVVNVRQGDYTDADYVEGAGDVLDVTCDSTAHVYHVSVPLSFGRASWRVGAATVDGIISNCYSDQGFYCVTQAHFGPQAATIKTQGSSVR